MTRFPQGWGRVTAPCQRALTFGDRFTETQKQIQRKVTNTYVHMHTLAAEGQRYSEPRAGLLRGPPHPVHTRPCPPASEGEREARSGPWSQLPSLPPLSLPGAAETGWSMTGRWAQSQGKLRNSWGTLGCALPWLKAQTGPTRVAWKEGEGQAPTGPDPWDRFCPQATLTGHPASAKNHSCL